MRARDVMTAPAVVVPPDAKVEDIAKLLLRRGISAVPVTGSDGRLAGIVSEGDLMRRVESGTERRRRGRYAGRDRLAARAPSHQARSVVRDGKVIGIVSRANLLQGLASQPAVSPPLPAGDGPLRERVEAEIRRAGVDAIFVNVVATAGEVHLWGATRSAQQADAARVAAETVAGGAAVTSHLSVMPDSMWVMMGAK